MKGYFKGRNEDTEDFVKEKAQQAKEKLKSTARDVS
jgi:hypothetical protein